MNGKCGKGNREIKAVFTTTQKMNLSSFLFLIIVKICICSTVAKSCNKINYMYICSFVHTCKSKMPIFNQLSGWFTVYVCTCTCTCTIVFYFILFSTYYFALMFPYHSPEIFHSVLHGTLCSKECSLLSVTLQEII